MHVIRFKFALSLLLLLTISVIFLCAIYLKSDLSKITSTSTKLMQAQEFLQESNSELDDEFLVNTLGCKMSRLPVMTSEIQKFFVPPDKIVCLPPAITESDECKKWCSSIIFLNIIT